MCHVDAAIEGVACAESGTDMGSGRRGSAPGPAWRDCRGCRRTLSRDLLSLAAERTGVMLMTRKAAPLFHDVS